MKTIIAALFVLFFSPSAPLLAKTRDAEMARKETLTDNLGEGDIIHFADGTQMVGADYFTVYIEGEGPDVVLIPDLSTPRAVWDKTREQLRGRYKVHTIQTRGFGDKGPTETLTPERRTLFETYAFHLADYIDDYVIDIGKGTHPAIIGHGLGGQTAMKIATEMGHQVDRVLLVSSVPFVGIYFGDNLSIDTFKSGAEIIREDFLAKKSEDPYDEVPQSMSITEKGRKTVKAWANSADPEVIAQYSYAMLTTDLQAELGKIRLPMTVLYPWDSTTTPEAEFDALYQNAFAEAKAAKFKRIDKSRHFIMVDQPEAFAAAVEEFLKD